MIFQHSFKTSQVILTTFLCNKMSVTVTSPNQLTTMIGTNRNHLLLLVAWISVSFSISVYFDDKYNSNKRPTGKVPFWLKPSKLFMSVMPLAEKKLCYKYCDWRSCPLGLLYFNIVQVCNT